MTTNPMRYWEVKYNDYKTDFIRCFLNIKSYVNSEACKKLVSLFLLFPVILKASKYYLLQNIYFNYQISFHISCHSDGNSYLILLAHHTVDKKNLLQYLSNHWIPNLFIHKWFLTY